MGVTDDLARGALRASLGLFSQYRGLAKIALVQAVGLGAVFEERRRALNDRLTRIIQTRLERAVDDGSIPPQRADISARAWVGALNEIVVHWIYTGEPPLEESLSRFVREHDARRLREAAA